VSQGSFPFCLLIWGMQGRACREGSGVGGWGQDWGIVKGGGCEERAVVMCDIKYVIINTQVTLHV